MRAAWLVALCGIAVAGNVARSQSPPVSHFPPDAQIRHILAERIDVQRQNVGIVVGLVDQAGRRIVAHGGMDLKSGLPVDGDSVFEIGSVTKVFTSILLADAVRRGEVTLSDPVSKHLPADVKVPERAGQQITLRDLAMHVSALPRLPNNFAPKDRGNPYADYSVKELYDFLSGYELPRDIGSRYEYSNLGAGLLGHVLARRAGTDYESLVRSRILQPLGMKSTAIVLDDGMKRRLAAGHNTEREPVPNWDLPTVAGAGALRSTVNDMLAFLSAQLGHAPSALTPVMQSLLSERRPTTSATLDIALAWHILKTSRGGEIVWHNGGTGGYRSYVGFDPQSRAGVVVLSNMSTPAGVDDIGSHVLDPSLPLARPPRKAITIDPALFDRYVGKYELKPGFVLTITREGSRFFLQATDQPRFEMFAEGERDFFLKAPDAQVTFEEVTDGRAARLTLHQGGAHLPAKRIE